MAGLRPVYVHVVLKIAHHRFWA